MHRAHTRTEKLEELAENDPTRVKIIKKAEVKELIYENGQVNGVVYELDGKSTRLPGAVILASGGYAADFAKDGLLAKYRPDTLPLSTTNGPHCTGDGHKMASLIGARTIDMEKVQVHPTGLVDPNEPDAKVKFLAAEALRGSGGLLLDNEGKRFVDELQHRDHVSNEMFKHDKVRPPLSSLRCIGANAPRSSLSASFSTLMPRRRLSGTASTSAFLLSSLFVFVAHTPPSVGRGLMKRIEGGDALAKEMGIKPETLKATFDDMNAICDGKKKDPFGKKFFDRNRTTVRSPSPSKRERRLNARTDERHLPRRSYAACPSLHHGVRSLALLVSRTS